MTIDLFCMWQPNGLSHLRFGPRTNSIGPPQLDLYSVAPMESGADQEFFSILKGQLIALAGHDTGTKHMMIWVDRGSPCFDRQDLPAGLDSHKD